MTKKLMKKIIIVIGITAAIGIAWYGLAPLFMEKRVDDTLPEAQTLRQSDSQASETSPETPATHESVPIVDTPSHPASGSVRIIKTETETILRYENYRTINGPDVRIYLSKDRDAKEFIDLGPMKGTEGNINYSIPAGTDLAGYRYALAWCEDFSVLFNSADISPLTK